MPRAVALTDRLALAAARGVRQAVILGAGLDTFALRNPHREQGLRVIEVDHPATQAWKRKRLAQAAIQHSCGGAYPRLARGRWWVTALRAPPYVSQRFARQTDGYDKVQYDLGSPSTCWAT
jgi:Leucine carboxyl methyltransferase